MKQIQDITTTKLSVQRKHPKKQASKTSLKNKPQHQHEHKGLAAKNGIKPNLGLC
jgi:membrane protein insertase Oxa1/YidC/SpoIIIJ